MLNVKSNPVKQKKETTFQVSIESETALRERLQKLGIALKIKNDTINKVFYYDGNAQGPEEMCLSLEHQTRQKHLKKWVILIALTIALQFRYTFCIPQTKRLRARKIGSQYKIRKRRKQIWGRFSNP